MDILNSLAENPELAEKISVNVGVNDLLSFAKELAAQLRPGPIVLSPEEKYLTADEVAEKLSVTRVTLWQWDKKGILKPAKIGNKVRYRQSDLDAVFLPIKKNGRT
jgi:excisionase family DNA binding protein